MSALRPTALGLGSKAVVAIELHRRAYHSGELVTGVVHATIQEPIACDALVVTVSGKEKVAWTERHSDKTRARCKKHAIFSEKIVIAQFTPAFYAPGSYAYPFAYQLPANLPGVFSLRDHGVEWANGVHASISYSLKASLDVGGVRHPIPRAVCALPVHEPVLKAPPRSEDAISRRVRYLRCISKGACDVAVKMDRNAYHPGDTAMIQCDVRNDSQVALRSMRFTLRQDVTLNVGYSSRPQSQIIATYNFPGVRAGDHVSQSLPLPLQVLKDGSAPPATSTCGKMVRCAYRVEIECDLPWSTGMVLRLPVTLVEPKGE